jgi:hypothetical protein
VLGRAPPKPLGLCPTRQARALYKQFLQFFCIFISLFGIFSSQSKNKGMILLSSFYKKTGKALKTLLKTV